MAFNYFKSQKLRNYYIEGTKLLITYNNKRKIDLNSEYTDYLYTFTISNNSKQSVKYKIILEIDENESKLYNYTLEGNPKIKNDKDILVNNSGRILKDDIILGEGIINSNYHYYTLNIKCKKCDGKLKGSIKLESR